MSSCSSHAMKLGSSSRYVTPLILNLDARWGWLVDATPRPVYLGKETRVPF
jgi:hypothetical protein